MMTIILFNSSPGHLIHHESKVSNKFDGMRSVNKQMRLVRYNTKDCTHGDNFRDHLRNLLKVDALTNKMNKFPGTKKYAK